MNTATHTTETAPEDRISLGQKSAYAIGMLVNNLQAAALPAMMISLVLGLKMDPILAGWISFIPRIFDAVSDPMMGYISDNTRSRWGRRRPYIFIGAILAGLVFIAMWQVPEGRSEGFYFWFFLVASVLFFLCYTVYATPFVAFGYEMTADYHERTRLQAFANVAGQVPWLIAGFFWSIMVSDVWSLDLFGFNFFRIEIESTIHGASLLAFVIGSVIICLGVFPAIFCREKLDKLQPVESKGLAGFAENTIDFGKGIFTTLSCKPFVKLCAATFLVFNGFQLGISFSLFVMIYYVFGGVAEGDQSADQLAGNLNGWFGFVTAAFTLAVIPLTAAISTRIGKRKTFLFTISLSILGYALKWFGYNPNHPYLLLAACPLVAFGTGSLFTLMGSMIADVCDYDELTSNQRREGIFGAIYWWMVKVGMGLAGLLSGFMLKASGFDVDLGANQSTETLLQLRIFDVVIPIVTSLIALGIMFSYSITEDRARDIRRQLEERRGKTEAE